jgi:hypothetical protein
MLRYSRSDRTFMETTDLVKLVEFTARYAQTQTNKFFRQACLCQNKSKKYFQKL